MKIKKEHFDYLKSEIETTLKQYPEIASEYEKGNFPRSERVKDLQKRFCFDLSYGAGLNQFICKELYPYMNDDHLYTALKRICPAVKKRY